MFAGSLCWFNNGGTRAEEEGLAIFIAAGFEWRRSGLLNVPCVNEVCCRPAIAVHQVRTVVISTDDRAGAERI